MHCSRPAFTTIRNTEYKLPPPEVLRNVETSRDPFVKKLSVTKIHGSDFYERVYGADEALRHRPLWGRKTQRPYARPWSSNTDSGADDRLSWQNAINNVQVIRVNIWTVRTKLQQHIRSLRIQTSSRPQNIKQPPRGYCQVQIIHLGS